MRSNMGGEKTMVVPEPLIVLTQNGQGRRGSYRHHHVHENIRMLHSHAALVAFNMLAVVNPHPPDREEFVLVDTAVSGYNQSQTRLTS